MIHYSGRDSTPMQNKHRSGGPEPHSKSPVFRSLALALVLIGMSANCSSDESVPSRLLAPVASSSAELSRNTSVAVINDRTACVIVSYEHEVQCLDRSGHLIGAFGRMGEGPGEFRFPHVVVRAPEQTVAVLDPLSSRFSVFKPTGELVDVVRVPEVFEPLSPIGKMMSGTFVLNLLSSTKILVEIEASTGTIVWQRELRSPSEIGLPQHCGLSWGALNKAGTAAFGACSSNLLFYPPDADGQITVVEAPTYTGELSNHRDIDEFREGMRFLFNGGAVPLAAVQEYAEAPKTDRIPGRAMLYDASDRLWVATQRDRDRSSYFDVYVDTSFLGSVQVRDRLLGFDIVDGTLVTLVDRALDEDDAYGVPDRGIDWYDIRTIW